MSRTLGSSEQFSFQIKDELPTAKKEAEKMGDENKGENGREEGSHVTFFCCVAVKLRGRN